MAGVPVSFWACRVGTNMDINQPAGGGNALSHPLLVDYTLVYLHRLAGALGGRHSRSSQGA